MTVRDLREHLNGLPDDMMVGISLMQPSKLDLLCSGAAVVGFRYQHSNEMAKGLPQGLNVCLAFWGTCNSFDELDWTSISEYKSKLIEVDE